MESDAKATRRASVSLILSLVCPVVPCLAVGRARQVDSGLQPIAEGFFLLGLILLSVGAYRSPNRKFLIAASILVNTVTLALVFMSYLK
jgi:hypothetical protein